MIEAIELVKGLGPNGQKVKAYVEAAFNGRLDPGKDVTLENFWTVRTLVGEQVKWFFAAAIAGLATLVVFKMKGDGFKRTFSLGGGKGRGPSLAAEAAKQWKTATASAYFDPDGRDKDILPARTPIEWLRDNKITFEDGELDRDGCERAFAEQLGKPWHGIQRADLPTQTVIILAGMHLLRVKGAMQNREAISMAWAAGGNGTQKMQEVVNEGLANQKLVDAIDKLCGKCGWAATAIITMIDFARKRAGVLPSSDFVWMRRVNRHLWYSVNNVGRRRFHTEGAGAMAHFFAERVVGNPLPEPHVDEAINGVEDYLAEQGIESLELFFKRQESPF
jgi:hypothetical protein